MQARDRHKMRDVGITHILQRPLQQASAIPRQYRRRKGTGIAGDPFLQSCRQGAAQPRQGRHPVLSGCQFQGQFQGRCAGIADRAKLLKPGVALKIEAARFRRALWRQKVPDHRYPCAGLRQIPALIPVQRDSHPVRYVPGGHPFKDNLIQRQSKRIRGGTVNLHDSPFDRAVIPEVQDWAGKRMRTHPPQGQPRRRQGQGQPCGAGLFRPAERTAQGGHRHPKYHGINHGSGFLPNLEIDRNANRQAYGCPRHQRPALALLQPVDPQPGAHYPCQPPLFPPYACAHS